MIRHFGVLIPSTNTTVETEYTRLLPPSLQAHYARLGKGQNVAFVPSRDDDLKYQSQLLGNAKVEVVALTQSSASMSDDDYDSNAKRYMSEACGAPALTSAEAIGQAIGALGGKRIGLVSPYSQAVMARTKRYYEMRYCVEVVANEGFGATDSYAIGALNADNATAAFARMDLAQIDLLVVLGGNFPTMCFIAAWEQEFGKPVLTTNQAVIWAVMTTMGINESLSGLGVLLQELPPAQ
jgi:maleate isomerase